MLNGYQNNPYRQSSFDKTPQTKQGYRDWIYRRLLIMTGENENQAASLADHYADVWENYSRYYPSDQG